MAPETANDGRAEPTQHLGQTVDPDLCTCPIHVDGGPMTVPKGISFSERVTVEEIDPEIANEIYEAHHSYCDELERSFDRGNHGIFVDGEIAGALSYNYKNMHKMQLHMESDGTFHRNDDRAGPDTVTKNIMGDQFAHVARICIGVDFPNLASCALAKSQEHFVKRTKQDVDFLVTYIRADHVGHMLRALIDKGWQLTGFTRNSASPGNREHQEIYNWQKARWVLPIGDSLEQIRDCPCTDDMLTTVGKSYVCSSCRSWFGYTSCDWAPNN